MLNRIFNTIKKLLYLNSDHSSILLTLNTCIVPINADIPQGAIFSPILYNIYASNQPTTLYKLITEYTDDKAIISINADPLLTSRNLQNHLHLMEE